MTLPERNQIINNLERQKNLFEENSSENSSTPEASAYIFIMPSPEPDEIERIRFEELTPQFIENPTPQELKEQELKQAAVVFAFSLEALTGNVPNPDFQADIYNPVHVSVVNNENGKPFYTRITASPDSPHLGLIFTSIDLKKLKKNEDNFPEIYEMGPTLRTLALAQRADFLLENQNEEIQMLIDEFESGKICIPSRSNRRHLAVEEALQLYQPAIRKIIFGLGRLAPNRLKQMVLPLWQAIHTTALVEIGYRKSSSDQIVSRKIKENDYLFNKIGKHYRRIIGGGSMPPTTGGKDALVTAAIGHMAIFIPRNSVFTGDINRQIHLFERATADIDALPIDEKWKERAKRNIGASLGVDNPEQTIQEAQQLYNAGIRLFRIYTIGADPRVIETARHLRQTFGDEIEIFVGQIADKKEAKRLIAQDIRVDAIIFGHGGGRQCTSAENGMAVTTLEELYEIICDPQFNKTTLLLEGGVGRDIGAMLILGVDGVLYNQRIVHGTIESPAGDIFFGFEEDGEVKYVQPYPGSASNVTQLIESVNPLIRLRRTNRAGRITEEGEPGFMFHERKGSSMAFWINGLLTDASRMFADLGVRNLSELRIKIAKDRREFLRYKSLGATESGKAYGNHR